MDHDRPLTLLVVDDDRHVRESIAEFFEDQDACVLQASRGGEAVELFRQGRPDVTLLDLRMPGMQGIELLQELRAIDPEAPILIVSGTGQMGDAIQALRLGAWDFITKPVHDLEVLEHAVHKAVERAALIDENRRYQEHLQQEVDKRTAELRLELTRRIEAQQEKEKVRAQLRQAQKMEAIGQLAGGVAHDFNNLLTGILGHAELLSLGGNLDGRQKDMLDRIQSASMRAAELTGKLLSFARRGKCRTIRFDLHDTLKDVTHLLRHTIDRSIEIRTECRADVSTMMGDPTELHSALLNLGVNARDAMSDGGTLTFATRNVEAPGGPLVEVSVTDTGTGISEDVQQYIFEPFFTTKDPGKGTGLGLAAVYGCVAEHNGTLDLDSAPGRGTTFRLTFAAAEPRSQASTTGDEEALPRGTETLLLVEDEEVVRRYALQALAGLGYRVQEFADGDRATDWIDLHPGQCDLVVLDLVLPGSGATGVLSTLQARCPGVPVLVCSGGPTDEVSEHLRNLGVVDFLPKPFGIGRLARAVRQCLDRTVLEEEKAG